MGRLMERLGPQERPDFDLVRQRMDSAHRYWTLTHEIYREDRVFYSDPVAQWDAQTLQEREELNKPILSINLLRTFIANIHSQIMADRIGIKVVPRDMSNAITFREINGEREIPLSEVYRSIWFQITGQSQMPAVLGRAVDQFLTGGLGYLMHDDGPDPLNPFRRRISIQHLPDPTGVLIDPVCQSPTFSDMTFAFVSLWRSKQEIMELFKISEDEFMAVSGSTWPGSDVGESRAWNSQLAHGEDGNDGTGRIHRVVRHYWTQRMEATHIVTEGGNSFRVFDDDGMDIDATVQSISLRHGAVDTVRATTERVFSCLMLADGTMQDPRPVPGRRIPIYPLIANPSMTLGGEIHYPSAIYYMRDAQKQYNFIQSSALSLIGQVSTARVFIPESTLNQTMKEAIESGDEHIPFDDSNPNAKVPQPAFPTNVPNSVFNEISNLTQSLQRVIGLDAASMGQAERTLSGSAINLHQNAAHANIMPWVRAVHNAVKALAEGVVHAIPEVYTDEQAIRIHDPAGDAHVMINEGIATPQGLYVADLTSPSMDIDLDLAPLSDNQNTHNSQLLMELAKTDQRIASVVLPEVILKSGIANADRIAEQLLLMLPQNLLTPEQRKRLENYPKPEPTPEQQVEMAKAQAQMAQSQTTRKVAEINLERAEKGLESDSMDVQKSMLDTLRSAKDAENPMLSQIVKALAPIINKMVADQVAGERQPAQAETEQPQQPMEQAS